MIINEILFKNVNSIEEKLKIFICWYCDNTFIVKDSNKNILISISPGEMEDVKLKKLQEAIINICEVYDIEFETIYC